MKNTNQKTMYILFADIKGYSANKKNLELLAEIEDLLYGFGEQYFGDTQNNCFKVLGDGILATNYDIKSMAESALQIIKIFKEKKFEHFTEKPKIRIALHVGKKESVTERRLKDKSLKDVAGEPVIETARIEPIVMPNEVFCSQNFATILESTNIENIKTTPLGNFKLGKGHDPFDIDLCVLHNTNEPKNMESLKKHIEDKLAKPEPASKLVESFYYFGAVENYNYTFVQNTDNSTTETYKGKYVTKIEEVKDGAILNIGDKNK